MRNYFIIALLVFPGVFSCINTKRATYFNKIKDSVTYDSLQIPEHFIKPNDLLSINISSANPEAAKIFNQPNQSEIRSTTPTGDIVEPAGYLVNKNGSIQFLILGTIKAEGLTTHQLQEHIRNALLSRKLLLDPVVKVRFLNFKVTVLGEVARPTVITVPNEKITLLEALGLAGDITIFGKRSNVLVIREEAGKKVTKRINLNSYDLFKSPYYYLKSNDIVYIEPNKARIAGGTRFYQLLPTIISSFSVIIIVIDRLGN
ncbi:polysaccharide biosynthesis protein [Adhaeribacter aerolatus]|uniref:Polysaccharide biosynthesis protein n=1 Tax=Adhaeribacter aerolatus TaxID=670289 RepID=A0A512B225_9BACT|nr:polysaccharide biosynthesis/export family protein [Adhaeribacter aerolatus]GEO06006.1 polysaccharide biosynthesis protein [Adhaeribacter aerolatus]